MEKTGASPVSPIHGQSLTFLVKHSKTTLRYLSEPGWMDGCAREMISKVHELCPDLEHLYFTDFYFSRSPSLLSSLSKAKKLKKIWILEGVDESSFSNHDLSEVISDQHKDILKKVAIYQPHR